jgi:hypothetical protein
MKWLHPSWCTLSVRSGRDQGHACLETRRLRGVRGPLGSHWPVEEAVGNDVVFVAGGSGLAPLRPVVYYLLANRQRRAKSSCSMGYGCRRIYSIIVSSNSGVDAMTSVYRSLWMARWACATDGDIQAVRNFKDVQEFVAIVYATPAYIDTLATSTPIAAHVRVDFELHGYPINRHQPLEAISAFLHGRKPHIPPTQRLHRM